MSLTGKGKRNATNYRAGGTRGGRSEFQWESVKNEKYRENYLGHSVMAPVGRWQRGKDLTWFAKDKKEQARVAADERARIIEMEKQMRAERLGLAPKTHRDPGNQLVDHELDVLRRGNIERDEKEMSGSRVDGLGAADAPTHAVQATSRFSGEAADRLPGSIAAYAASQAAAGAGAPSPPAAVAESARDKRARPDWDSGSGGGGGGGAEATVAEGADDGKWARDKKRHKKHRKKKKKNSKKHSSKDSKKKKKKKKSLKQKKKHSRRKRHDSSASSSGHGSGSGSDSGSSSGSASGSEGSGSDADLAAIQAQIRAQEEKLRALAGDQ